MTLTHKRQRSLAIAGWVLFAAMFMPAFMPELVSIPAIAFWFLPLTLPFWFGMFAALAMGRLRKSERASGWSVFHTIITIFGAVMLALWVLLIWNNGDHFPEAGRWVGAVAYLALLPASLKLFSSRRAEWRLYRALTLNALGCLIFAGQVMLLSIFDSGSVPMYPGPGMVLAVAALITIAIVARRLEQATEERDQLAELPAARVAR